MKELNDSGLLRIIGSVIDGTFKDFGKFVYRDMRISILKKRNKNEYMRDYMRKHSASINALRRKKYKVAMEQKKCPRCLKANASEFSICSRCRKIKYGDKK